MRRNWIGLCVWLSCVAGLAACTTIPQEVEESDLPVKEQVVASKNQADWQSTVHPTLAPVVASTTPETTIERAFVLRVISGNTIRARFADGKVHDIRCIGIKAAEKEERFHWTGQRILCEFVLKKEVILESDGRDEDRYNRKLRHVFVLDPRTGDKIYVNGALVWQGVAFITQWTENCKYMSVLKAKQEEAQRAFRRIWRKRSAISGSTTSSSRVSCKLDVCT